MYFVSIPRMVSLLWTLAVVTMGAVGPLASQEGVERQDKGTGTRTESASLSAFEATPLPVVKKMLELAEVRPNERVYDLGSGDGRVLIMAAQKFGARAVGIELDPHLYQESRAKVWNLGLRDRVQVVLGDVLEQDLSLADVVTIHMTPYALWKLRPHLEKFLHQGMRIVTVTDQIPEWKSAATTTVEGGNGRAYKLTLYVVDEPRPWTSFSKFGRTQ